jgi:hypothetical protein
VFVGFSRIFLLGILIFKVLTARRLYKSFGVKWVIKRNKYICLFQITYFYNICLLYENIATFYTYDLFDVSRVAVWPKGFNREKCKNSISDILSPWRWTIILVGKDVGGIINKKYKLAQEISNKFYTCNTIGRKLYNIKQNFSFYSCFTGHTTWSGLLEEWIILKNNYRGLLEVWTPLRSPLGLHTSKFDFQFQMPVF